MVNITNNQNPGAKKLLLIIAATLIAIGGLVLFQRARSSQTLKPNQAAVTGITVVLARPVSNVLLSVTNSQGQPVKQLDLVGMSTRYNFELPPGVYRLMATSPDNLFAPLESPAVTVTVGQLSEVSFVVPVPHQE